MRRAPHIRASGLHNAGIYHLEMYISCFDIDGVLSVPPRLGRAVSASHMIAYTMTGTNFQQMYSNPPPANPILLSSPPLTMYPLQLPAIP